MKFEFLKDWSVIIFSPDHTDEINPVLYVKQSQSIL